MTRRLAGEGYSVLALDLYNGQVATDPEAARDLMRSVMDNPGSAQENITQAANFLKTDYSAPKLGSIGWCFGGNWSLRTGLLLSSDLDAMAIYYGQLILAPEALDGLDMPIIGFFGEDDSSIPVEDVQNFESTLDSMGKTADINLYPASPCFCQPFWPKLRRCRRRRCLGKNDYLLQYLSQGLIKVQVSGLRLRA